VRVFIDTADLETAVAVREAVTAEGHDIEMVESLREIENRMKEGEEDVALVVSGDPAGETARKLRAPFEERIPRPPVLGFVAEGEEESETTAGDAERLGFDELLSRPPDRGEIQVVLEGQAERYDLQLETGIVGRTRAIRDVIERIHLVAPVSSTVLLTGESGTGKELVARAIHRYSRRRGRAFIAVNCAALPESLLESELFGHEKGAFTGATSRRAGMFELADGGTIFLDEIGEMPSALQTRLLRVLEQRRFMRVGGDSEIEVNVRVIAATNRDLRTAVRSGDFRRDLFYRLNVLQIELPPLRDRKRDVPVLVRNFVGELTEAHGREFKGLTEEAMGILLDYDWPGNVRELRNLVESMVVLAPGSVIRAEDIPDEIRSARGRSMLPAPTSPVDGEARGSVAALRRRESEAAEEGGEGVSGMEFIFRTLIDLRMDVEDLRREFERYRERHPELLEEGAGRRRGTEIEISALPGPDVSAPEEGESPESAPGEGGASGRAAPEEAEEEVIEFRPGMTMDELEREAIVATLKSVGGNRRRAAEQLGIGERTLYRKLRAYDIDL